MKGRFKVGDHVSWNSEAGREFCHGRAFESRGGLHLQEFIKEFTGLLASPPSIRVYEVAQARNLEL